MTGIGYASVNAKIRYWLSYLLKAEDADLLSRASMNEIIDFIRKHELKSSIDSNNLTDIESAVKQAIVDYVRSGLRFLSGGSRAFIEEWMKIYEIEDLKIIARAIVGKRPVDFLYRLQYNSRFNSRPFKGIQTSTSIRNSCAVRSIISIASYTFPRVKEENNTFTGDDAGHQTP
jgi:vacuolar-type H+-ATPase subunit C/Vma6